MRGAATAAEFETVGRLAAACRSQPMMLEFRSRSFITWLLIGHRRYPILVGFALLLHLRDERLVKRSDEIWNLY